MNLRSFMRVILVFVVAGIFVLMAARTNGSASREKRAHSSKEKNESIQPELIIWESLGTTVLACSQ